MIRCDTLPPINLKEGQGQAFDLNRTGETRVYLVGPYSTCSVQADGDASWGTAILTLSRSNDGSHVYDLETGVTTIGPGAGISGTIDCAGFNYLHVRLTTLEGGADTCTLTVIGKTLA